MLSRWSIEHSKFEHFYVSYIKVCNEFCSEIKRKESRVLFYQESFMILCLTPTNKIILKEFCFTFLREDVGQTCKILLILVYFEA